MMSNYVILHHVMPPNSGRSSHYDLMLEQAGELVTWALDRPPQPGSLVAATRLPNHRIDYLTYEGPVSRGRGDVSRWDEGTFEIRSATPQAWHVDLNGRRLNGTLRLDRDVATKSTSAAAEASQDDQRDATPDQRWTCGFAADAC